MGELIVVLGNNVLVWVKETIVGLVNLAREEDKAVEDIVEACHLRLSLLRSNFKRFNDWTLDSKQNRLNSPKLLPKGMSNLPHYSTLHLLTRRLYCNNWEDYWKLEPSWNV